MENNKQVGSSPSTSSFNDLFGSKESQTTSSATGVFASIFQPPSKVLGRYTGSSSEARGSWQKQPSGNQEWNTRKENPAKSGNGASTSRKDQEGRAEPCHLSSSLYYGGQDIYSQSSSTQGQAYGSYPIFKKDGEEEEGSNGNNSQSASRGNWWEGSLYY